MIIEFYGLPGSGKSYLIRQLNGNKPIGMMTESKFRAFLIRIAKKAAILAPDSLLLRNRIKNLLHGVSDKPVFFERSKQYYLNNLTMLAFGYRWSGNRNIYMDEGIIHRLTSMAVNYDLSVDLLLGLLDLFQEYLKPIKVFYLDVGIEECLESIQKRNRHEFEMDALSGEKLFYFLSNYQKYFDAINRKYKYEVVTRDNYEDIRRLLK